jgi:transglutaminase-like putative cysteine protease
MMASALALGFAGLLTPDVCLLTLLLIVIVGMIVPSTLPWLAAGSAQRNTVALFAIAVVVAATALSGPGGLGTGNLTGTVGQLSLPSNVPLGLLAALAAGALVSVSLELGDRRGLHSALILGVCVLGLAGVAAPGRHLIPVLVIGWPTALFTLTQLTAPVQAIDVRVDPHPAGTRRVVTRWVLMPIAITIAVACVVVLIAARTGLSTANPQTGGWNSPGTGDTPSAALRSPSDYLGGAMNLSARGHLSAEPLIKVPAGSPRLWRAGTLDVYTGRGWLAAQAPAPVQIHPDGSLSVQTSTGSTQVDTVVPLHAGVTQVIAPGQVLAVTAKSLVGGSALPAAGNRLTIADSAGRAIPYTVTSQLLPSADDPGAVAQLSRPAGVAQPIDPRWSELPVTVPRRVRELGIALAGSRSRLDAVHAIEHELAQRMTYNLDSPAPAPGVDAVDDVLFTSHTGFCEQFASAEVVLLRSAGIPARMAVGFAGTEPGHNGYRTLQRSDAHAWVEVWFPGVGWVDSDPTPAGTAATRSSLASDNAIWICAVMFALAVALLLYRRRRRPGSLRPRDDLIADRELADAFAGFSQTLAAQHSGREPSETLAAWAGRIAVGDDAQSLRTAFDVLERSLYAPVAPSPQECRAAAAALRHHRMPAAAR